MVCVTEQTIYQHLREFAERFTPPAPFSGHVEISDGHIIMMMSRAGRHDQAAWLIAKQLEGQLPEGVIATTSGLRKESSHGVPGPRRPSFRGSSAASCSPRFQPSNAWLRRSTASCTWISAPTRKARRTPRPLGVGRRRSCVRVWAYVSRTRMQAWPRQWGIDC
jgi:hypothetical protein